MKILIVGTSFHTSYGGPAVSVAGLAGALSEVGAQVGVWAPDGSAVTLQGLAERGATLFDGGLRGAVERFGRPDVMHDNGIWLPHNHLVRRISESVVTNRVVSPRGMLDPWSRRQKKLKKLVAWIAYQKRDICAASQIHVTSGAELESVSALGLDLPVQCIPNGITIEPMPSREKRSPFRTALFLGRLHPVKGLDILLSAWAKIRPLNWKLVIAGPGEDGYDSFLKREAGRLDIMDTVDFSGPVIGKEKQNMLCNADLFVLPSRSESFGMAIAEALGAGLPVLTTTSAPWPEIVSEGCGWRVELNEDDFTHALDVATTSNARCLTRMGIAGYNFVRRKFDWSNLAPLYLNMYEEAVARPQRLG